ncbi:MAG: alpha/beta hydrolase [Verrucomicrobiae bacterium]|nr:alpha/beta hydrolase [Verrucomicrobiae bacterium]NNJ43939.1 prolyl oligopeptidase family serine peptidase [Akkermansiaceae bacterium]
MQSIIKNNVGETLDSTWARGAGGLRQSDWIVVLGHGVTGDKDRPLIVDTAAALNAAGFDTLRFSFAGNGQSDGDFRDATITKEVGDLDAVLSAVASSYSHIGYIGHSMGAAVGVIQSAKDPRISALVSLAGMIDTKAFAKTEFGQETPDDGLMWEEESCPLSSAFMTDLCETIQSIAEQARCVTAPWILLHGSADDVVLPRDTEQVQQMHGDAVQVVCVDGADHSFNQPAHKEQATDAVVTWLTALAAR